MDERSIIALCLVSGLGPVTWRKLSTVLGGVTQVLEVSEQELVQAGATARLAKSIRSFSDWEQVDQRLELLRQSGGRMLIFGQEGYPEPLTHLHDAPMVLFAQGEISPSDEVSVAIVGTRRPSGYGKRIARKLAFQIASSGVTVVSGLALGIDGEAHKGAIDARGRTIAVLGSGLDRLSPARHQELAGLVAQNGAVLTESLPGADPLPGNFPRRNRIVAGLSAAVLVVEMPDKSGAGITAKCAVDQNKDVLVVPGPIDNENFIGSHRWIRDGARPVFDAMDVLENVLPEAARRIGRQTSLLNEVSQGGASMKLPPDQARIFKEIGSDPIHIDTIASNSGLTIENVSTILLELELRNLIVQLPGKLFRLT